MNNTKLSLFTVNIEPMKEGGFFAECPVLQGCHAEGETFSDVIANIQDVIRVHLECRKEHGDIVPEITLKKPESLSINLPLPILDKSFHGSKISYA